MSQFHDDVISVSLSQVFRVEVPFRPTKFDAHMARIFVASILHAAKSFFGHSSIRMRGVTFLNLTKVAFPIVIQTSCSFRRVYCAELLRNVCVKKD